MYVCTVYTVNVILCINNRIPLLSSVFGQASTQHHKQSSMNSHIRLYLLSLLPLLLSSALPLHSYHCRLLFSFLAAETLVQCQTDRHRHTSMTNIGHQLPCGSEKTKKDANREMSKPVLKLYNFLHLTLFSEIPV